MPKILVVDDEDTVRDVLDTFLKKKNFDVVTVDSGSAALETLSGDGSIDLMILDNKMPGMKGTEVLHEMEKRNMELPVILLTGSISLGDRIGDGKILLRKPIDLNELINNINKLLNL